MVTELIPDEFSRTLTAAVRPAADLDGLKTLMIITEYTIAPYTYEDIDPSLTPETTPDSPESTQTDGQGGEVAP